MAVEPLVTHRWRRDAQCEVDCALYYASQSQEGESLCGMLLAGKEKKNLKEDLI